MGYRSKICLALSKAGVRTFQEKLENASEKTGVEVRSLLNYAEKRYFDDATGAKCWYWPWIKWYQEESDDYPDVDFIEKFMDELPNDEFCFIRIGENYEDVEVRGWWWDNPFGISLIRAISLPL